MNVRNEISIYRSYADPVPALEISIEDFCVNIITGDYKNEVLAIRDLTDKADRDRIKATLPAATVSGTFTRRNNAGLKQHSGFICLDFDAKANPQINNWIEARDEIGEIKEVLFCALSVSGRGCFAILPISYPGEHRRQFEALKRDFQYMGYAIDNTPDVSRLRGISYDPGATWNTAAFEYRRMYYPPIPKHNSLASGQPNMASIKDWVDKRQVFTAGTRNIWIADFAGVCHRLGIAQIECNAELIRYSSTDFTENEILRTIDSIYKNQTWKSKSN